jgi:hypothetical protein
LDKGRILWVNWIAENDFLVVCQFGVKQGGCCERRNRRVERCVIVCEMREAEDEE